MIKEKHTKLRITEAFFSLQEIQVYLSINKLSNGKRNMTVNVQHKIIVDDTRLSLRQKYRIGSHLYWHQFKFIVNHCMAPHGQLHHRCVVYISMGGNFDHFFLFSSVVATPLNLNQQQLNRIISSQPKANESWDLFVVK